MKGKEYVSVIIVSPEFLIVVGACVALFLFPQQVARISGLLSGESARIVEYLAFLPATVFVWVVRESRKLLFLTDEKQNWILHKWPDYWRLRVRFNVALGYALLFALLGFGVWVFGLKVSDAKGFLLLLVSNLGGFTVATTVYFARVREEEIMAALVSWQGDDGLTGRRSRPPSRGG